MVLALKAELDRVYKQSEVAFVSGNPYMTHEIKAKLVGREQLLVELLALFEDENTELLFNQENGFEVIEEKQVE